MEKRRLRLKYSSYDRKRMAKHMASQHPIDTEIRDRLRILAPRQIEIAQRLGRSQGWLNKYIHGAGHATIDDVIKIAAILTGVDAPRLTDAERRLLRLWRGLEADDQQDVVDFLEMRGRRRRGQAAARSARTPRGASHKGPDTR
jgi:transcriptional regulator with XRE-family HTH domain